MAYVTELVFVVNKTGLDRLNTLLKNCSPKVRDFFVKNPTGSVKLKKNGYFLYGMCNAIPEDVIDGVTLLAIEDDILGKNCHYLVQGEYENDRDKGGVGVQYKNTSFNSPFKEKFGKIPADPNDPDDYDTFCIDYVE